MWLWESRKKRHPENSHHEESYYDLFDDWDLIESSFLKQYGIRLREVDDMPYSEFCSLISGIMPDTPLGNVVSIRAEKDPKVIKSFTAGQKKIRSDWILRKSEKVKENPSESSVNWVEFQKWAKEAFSN